VPLVNLESLFNLASALCDLRSYLVDVAVDVYAVRYRPLVTIFLHKILIEKAERLFVRRRCQSDEIRIEIFEYLSPKVVNRAVTFIRNNKVERLNRNLRIVGDRKRVLEN